MTYGNRNRGFTLLEVLIAISIFSLIGLASYTLLAAVIGTNETTSSQSNELRDLQLTFAVLQQDLAQLKAMPASAEQETTAGFAMDGRAAKLDFVRGGRTNPLSLKRSDLMAVSYVLKQSGGGIDGNLVRYSSSTSEVGSSSRFITNNDMPTARVMTQHIREFTVRALNDDGEWSSTWEAPTAVQESEIEIPKLLSPLPSAIEVTLFHSHYGEVRRIFNVPRGILMPAQTVEDELR